MFKSLGKYAAKFANWAIGNPDELLAIVKTIIAAKKGSKNG